MPVKGVVPPGLAAWHSAHGHGVVNRTYSKGSAPVAAKTASVGGVQHPASDFAYVGDPADPSTWKLPIFDKAHADNAAARLNQTQGIPADAMAGVKAKIVAAQDKFGTKAPTPAVLAPSKKQALIDALKSGK